MSNSDSNLTQRINRRHNKIDVKIRSKPQRFILRIIRMWTCSTGNQHPSEALKSAGSVLTYYSSKSKQTTNTKSSSKSLKSRSTAVAPSEKNIGGGGENDVTFNNVILPVA